MGQEQKIKVIPVLLTPVLGGEGLKFFEGITLTMKKMNQLFSKHLYSQNISDIMFLLIWYHSQPL